MDGYDDDGDPGGVIQDIVHYLWTDNVVAHGQLPMEGTDGHLDRVTANVLNITGANDPGKGRCQMVRRVRIRQKMRRVHYVHPPRLTPA